MHVRIESGGATLFKWRGGTCPEEEKNEARYCQDEHDSDAD